MFSGRALQHGRSPSRIVKRRIDLALSGEFKSARSVATASVIV